MGPFDQLEPIEKASVDALRALQLERLRWTLRHAYDKVKGTIGVAAKVRVTEPGDLPRSQGKAVRFIDKRPKA